MARVLIGTSGWTYASWKGRFYPKELPARRYLEYYSNEFETTEVNYSFYHLPRPETFARWADRVPSGFVFSVKASRLITHVKRLQNAEDAWTTFMTNARALRAHLGPILLQFPASFPYDHGRLGSFLERAQIPESRAEPLRLVFEFRHASWFQKGVYDALRRHGAALCHADSPNYPRCDVTTADFIYLRFHGPTRLFASNYPLKKLEAEARRLRGYLAEGRDVFAYFNNDALGHAVANARTLRELVQAEA